MLTSYNTNASYIQHLQKNNGQQPVTAPRNVSKVSSSHSAEPAPKVEAEPVTKVKAQRVGNVEATTQPVLNVKAQPPAKVVTQNITSVQKTKAKKSKSEKPTKAKKVQAITYFGLIWKKNKNDKDDGSEFRANDVILKSKDDIGSSIKPKCCLCDKAYSPEFLYVRCERCKNWFHGDSLQLEEDRIGELVGYRCCRCRRRAIPPCPHSDNYVKPEPEFSEQTVATSSVSTMLSSGKTSASADQDPLLASYGIVEPIGEETGDVDLSANTASIAPGSSQKLSIRRALAKTSGYLDQAGKSVNEYYVQNQNTPPGNGNINFSHTNEISFSEADSVGASGLLGWDFSRGTAYAAPPGFTSNRQQNRTSRGSFVPDECEREPQTYFSFTELLEADDAQLDDNAFGIATGLQGDANGSGSFVQRGVSFGGTSFMAEDGASNMNVPTNGPTPEEVACHNSTNTQPPPDPRCSVRDLRTHR